MPREDARRYLAREWLTRADRDLRAAVLAFNSGDDLWEIVAFHSQQAAEKALKAFLAWHNVPFRRTHNLVELLEQCAEVDGTFTSLRESAAELTRFAVDPRYPGMADSPDAQVAEDALRRGRDVIAFVLQKLPPEVKT